MSFHTQRWGTFTVYFHTKLCVSRSSDPLNADNKPKAKGIFSRPTHSYFTFEGKCYLKQSRNIFPRSVFFLLSVYRVRGASVAIVARLTRYYLTPHPWRCGPTRAMASSFTGYLDHTKRRITVGRTPLDAWTVCRRDLYRQHTTLTTDRRPCPRWDSKPQSQQATGCRPTP